MVKHHSMYDKFTFPEYSYKEYPKWIELAGGERKIVESRYEEILARGEELTPEQERELERTKNPVVAENSELKTRLALMEEQMAMLLGKMGDKTPVSGSPPTSGEKLSSNAPLAPTKSAGEKIAEQAGVPVAKMDERAIPTPNPNSPVDAPAPSGLGTPGTTANTPLASLGKK